MLRKIGQNFQIALPREIIKKLQLHVNDYLDIQIQNFQITLAPQILIPKDQEYFYTPEWQEQEKEAADDIQKGRVTKTKDLNQLFKKLDS